MPSAALLRWERLGRREGAGTKGGREKVGKKGSHVTGAGEPEGHGACGSDVAAAEVRVVCV